MLYTTTGSVAVGAIVNRAWQRRDPGSWTLATALSLVIAGVIAWATAKFGPDLRIPAIMLMVVGVALTPLAISNPGHGRPVVVDKGEERDRLGALAFHLTCWGVAWWHLVHQPMTAPMAVMKTCAQARLKELPQPRHLPTVTVISIPRAVANAPARAFPST